MQRYHSLKFNSNIDDLVYKKLNDCEAIFTIESLRLAFNRISMDNLCCIVTLHEEGLSVKYIEAENFMIECIVL